MDAMSAHDAPTTELVAGAVGDRCANCQSPMSSDQRYCVNCGARRGKARFNASAMALATPQAAASAAPPPRSRTPAGATLIAGVATLLIAIGVGVLIGHDSSRSAGRTSPLVVTVGNSGSSAPAANTTAATTANTTSHQGKAKSAKTVVVHITPKTSKAAATAASHVFGNNGNLSKNVTQQQGGACTGGAGCQGGKFTGNFFGQ